MLAAHRVPLRREFLDPALVLESILSFYSSKIAFKNIAVERRFDNNLDQIYASPTEVQQIFSNLVANALESVRPAGTLVLRVYASRPWEERRGIRVLVADDGPGIEPEFRGKIFEPFFTTKEKGSGLGLWVCRVLVERNGGSIRFHTTTRAGHSGTAFLVFLPSEGRSPPTELPDPDARPISRLSCDRLKESGRVAQLEEQCPFKCSLLLRTRFPCPDFNRLQRSGSPNSGPNRPVRRLLSADCALGFCWISRKVTVSG
jgi:Histidine kinase-, DNA gyrase B-, and HSP90-like ATPase